MGLFFQTDRTWVDYQVGGFSEVSGAKHFLSLWLSMLEKYM